MFILVEESPHSTHPKSLAPEKGLNDMVALLEKNRALKLLVNMVNLTWDVAVKICFHDNGLRLQATKKRYRTSHGIPICDTADQYFADFSLSYDGRNHWKDRKTLLDCNISNKHQETRCVNLQFSDPLRHLFSPNSEEQKWHQSCRNAQTVAGIAEYYSWFISC